MKTIKELGQHVEKLMLYVADYEELEKMDSLLVDDGLLKNGYVFSIKERFYAFCHYKTDSVLERYMPPFIADPFEPEREIYYKQMMSGMPDTVVHMHFPAVIEFCLPQREYGIGNIIISSRNGEYAHDEEMPDLYDGGVIGKVFYYPHSLTVGMMHKVKLLDSDMLRELVENPEKSTKFDQVLYTDEMAQKIIDSCTKSWDLSITNPDSTLVMLASDLDVFYLQKGFDRAVISGDLKTQVKEQWMKYGYPVYVDVDSNNKTYKVLRDVGNMESNCISCGWQSCFTFHEDLVPKQIMIWAYKFLLLGKDRDYMNWLDKYGMRVPERKKKEQLYECYVRKGWSFMEYIAEKGDKWLCVNYQNGRVTLTKECMKGVPKYGMFSTNGLDMVPKKEYDDIFSKVFKELSMTVKYFIDPPLFCELTEEDLKWRGRMFAVGPTCSRSYTRFITANETITISINDGSIGGGYNLYKKEDMLKTDMKAMETGRLDPKYWWLEVDTPYNRNRVCEFANLMVGDSTERWFEWFDEK